MTAREQAAWDLVGDLMLRIRMAHAALALDESRESRGVALALLTDAMAAYGPLTQAFDDYDAGRS